jgi:uncharacterized membrane protein
MNDASPNVWKRLGISGWLITRRRRRLWVVVTYAGWLVIAAVVRVLDLTAPDWPRTTVILLLANSAALLLWLGPQRTYESSPTFGYPEFDERMVQVKNEAFRSAYRVLSLSVVAAGMLTVAALSAQPGDQGIADGFVIWFGLLLLIALLPTTIVAWREPDPKEEPA